MDCLFDLQRIFRESSAKALAKEMVSMEALSPHSTFALSREAGNNETLLFIAMALHLPLAVSDHSHSWRSHAVWLCLSSTKVDNHNPAKEKRRLAKVYKFSPLGISPIKRKYPGNYPYNSPFCWLYKMFSFGVYKALLCGLWHSPRSKLASIL